MDLISEYVRICGIAGLYLFSIFGWGNLAALLLLRGAKEDFGDYVLARVIAGCATLYVGYIALSAAGLLLRIPVAILIVVGGIAGFAAIRELFGRIQERFRDIRSWGLIERVLAASVGVLVLLQLACGLTPLIFYDLQVYQLVAPAQFLQQGRLVEIPWNVLANSPMALQLMLGMSMALDPGGAAAKLLFAMFGCLLAASVAQFISDRKAALLAALFVLSYPEFWTHQAFGVIDLTVAAFLILGVVWARRIGAGESWRWTVLAGCAFGFVIGSRYQGIVPTVWLSVAALIEHIHSRRTFARSVLVRYAAMAGIAAVFVTPWLIKNAASFGNPVYPLLPNIFAVPGWSATQAARLNQEVFGPQLSTLPLSRWVTAPLGALIMMPSNGLFGVGLIFGALLALCICRKRDVRMAAMTGLGGLILWSILQPTPNAHLMRFNAVSIALLLIASAGLLAVEIPYDKGIRAGMMLAGGSLIIGLPFVQSINPVWQTLLSSTYREATWEANVPSWKAFDMINATLDPKQHKVLTIGETRGFWLRVPFLAPTAFDTPRLSETFSGSDEGLWRKRLTDLGITHLLISYPEWDRLRDNYDYLRLSAEDMSRLNSWFRTLPVVFDDGHGTLVLQVNGQGSHG